MDFCGGKLKMEGCRIEATFRKMIKPEKIYTLSLLLVLFLCFQVQAQSTATRVAKIEIDGKEVKKDYKVLLYTKNKSIEANRTAGGFIVPDEFKDEKQLGVTITLGKYELDFPGIHISNFNTVWTVGIDKKPFSKENSRHDEAKTADIAYYIKYASETGLNRMALVFITYDSKRSKAF